MRTGGILRECHRFSGCGFGRRYYCVKSSLKWISLEDVPDKVKFYTSRDPGVGVLEDKIPWSEKPKSFTCNQHFWESEGPRTIFVTRKETPQSLQYLYEIARWIQWNYPSTKLLIEETNLGKLENKEDLPIHVFRSSERKELSRVVDVIICLGGDGSLLYVSSTFGNGAIPPVIAFSLGTLSFLASFKAREYKKALESVFSGGFYFTNRMRLLCQVELSDPSSIPAHYQKSFVKDKSSVVPQKDIYKIELPLINDVTMHRGLEGQTLKIDCFVNGHLITKSSGDGLIVATATGSTAYSLSCGGSMVHPAIKAIMLTPVCARSLSFRPLILPWDVSVKLQISPDSRTQRGTISPDGLPSIPIKQEDVAIVSRSPFSVPTVSKDDAISDWAHDINEQLKWNQTPVPVSE